MAEDAVVSTPADSGVDADSERADRAVDAITNAIAADAASDAAALRGTATAEPGTAEPESGTTFAARAGVVLAGIRRQLRDLRRAALITLGVASLASASCLLLVIGAYTNDFKITARPGIAAAEVMSASYNRTVVRFSTPDGAVRVPRFGVLYPGGLQVGQVVRVEYDQANPDLVRVAGRGAWLTLVPVGTILLVVWALAGGVLWWLQYVRTRPRTAPVQPTAVDHSGH